MMIFHSPLTLSFSISIIFRRLCLWSIVPSTSPFRIPLLLSKTPRFSQRIASGRCGGDGYTYVEDGDLYSDEWDEIEAMGGDPFFLDDTNRDEDQELQTQSQLHFENVQEDSSLYTDELDEIEAMGGDPFFLDPPSSKQEDMAQTASSHFKTSDGGSMQAHDVDEIEAIGGDSFFLDESSQIKSQTDERDGDFGDVAPQSSFFESDWQEIRQLGVDPLFIEQSLLAANFAEESMGPGTFETGSFESDWEELEEIGGDPSFLQENGYGAITDAVDQSGEGFVWDGEIDEDAYFD